MAHWLYKSEPAAWSWQQQKDAGETGTEWTGVRNYLARNNMRAMQIGDKGFFYHSNDGLEIVGITEVCALSHPDSTAGEDPRWDCVDIRAVCDMPKPVTLKDIKANPKPRDLHPCQYGGADTAACAGNPAASGFRGA